LFSQARLTVSLFEGMMNILEQATGFETIIRLDQAEKLLNAQLSCPNFRPGKNQPPAMRDSCHTITKDVYSYWIAKRSKLRKPLLRQFWPTTATNDTNPHMVFRPREKERYKLRKKRQNDMDTLRKLQLLRNDFDRVRSTLEQVARRETLLRSVVQLRHDWFEQQVYDCVDTSGLPRHSSMTQSNGSTADLNVNDLDKLLQQAPSWDASKVGKMLKRKRGSSTLGTASESGTEDGTATPAPSLGENGMYLTSQGDPNLTVGVPNFTQPLAARREYVTSWDDSVPYVETFSGGKAMLFLDYRHRGRVGRGGRICIDRIPGASGGTANETSSSQKGTVQYVGHVPSYKASEPNAVFPPVFDKQEKRRRIQKIAAQFSDEDEQVELVQMKDWIDTDDQKWGEEKLMLGPI
jgi:enhancer of polycomb-like protein